jgi:hypothetical protein
MLHCKNEIVMLAMFLRTALIEAAPPMMSSFAVVPVAWTGFGKNKLTRLLENFPTAWGHPVRENASLTKLPERVS